MAQMAIAQPAGIWYHPTQRCHLLVGTTLGDGRGSCVGAWHRRKVAGMRNLWRKLQPYRRAAIEILLVAGILAILAGAVLALNYWLTDASRSATAAADIGRIKDVVGIVQLFAAAVIIVAGGIFAYRKLQWFRDFEPHLTVTQAVASRPVGTQYVHISVITTLRNSSKVKVEIREGFFRIQQIQPMSDEDVVHLYNQSFNSGAFSSIDWPVLDEIHRELGPNELVVEPGESHHEPCEFIVTKDVATILVYSYFYNQSHSENSRSAQGWTATTFHDVVLPESGNEGSYQED